MMCCSGAPNSPSAATRLSTAAAPNKSQRSLRPRSCSSWVSIVLLRFFRLHTRSCGQHEVEAPLGDSHLGHAAPVEVQVVLLDAVGEDDTALVHARGHVDRRALPDLAGADRRAGG